MVWPETGRPEMAWRRSHERPKATVSSSGPLLVVHCGQSAGPEARAAAHFDQDWSARARKRDATTALLCARRIPRTSPISNSPAHAVRRLASFRSGLFPNRPTLDSLVLSIREYTQVASPEIGSDDASFPRAGPRMAVANPHPRSDPAGGQPCTVVVPGNHREAAVVDPGNTGQVLPVAEPAVPAVLQGPRRCSSAPGAAAGGPISGNRPRRRYPIRERSSSTPGAQHRHP